MRLGIFPFAGPVPTTYLLEQRWRVARILLEAATNTAWPDDGRRASIVAADRLSSAHYLCLERLLAVIKGRRKDPKHASPRWAEA